MFDLKRFVIPKIAADWEDVARLLRYDNSTINSIGNKCCYDPESCCRELFEDWLTTSHGIAPKTWSTLLQKIKQVSDLMSAVEEIKKELMSTYGTCVCS